VESSDPARATSSAFTAILAAEKRLRASFENDVGTELELADKACSLLIHAMSAVEKPGAFLDADEISVPRSGDTQRLILLAQLGIAGRSLRSIRAARSSLEIGYEEEALVHHRVLLELWVHLKAILADPTGKEARAWLQAKRGSGISKRVADLGPENLYSRLSAYSHGDPRSLERMTNFDTGALQLAPRRTTATRAALVLHASHATDQARQIAWLVNIELPGHAELHHAIQARVDQIKQEEETPASPSQAQS
jgi:hypothetical protein